MEKERPRTMFDTNSFAHNNLLQNVTLFVYDYILGGGDEEILRLIDEREIDISLFPNIQKEIKKRKGLSNES